MESFFVCGKFLSQIVSLEAENSFFTKHKLLMKEMQERTATSEIKAAPSAATSASRKQPHFDKEI